MKNKLAKRNPSSQATRSGILIAIGVTIIWLSVMFVVVEQSLFPCPGERRIPVTGDWIYGSVNESVPVYHVATGEANEVIISYLATSNQSIVFIRLSDSTNTTLLIISTTQVNLESNGFVFTTDYPENVTLSIIRDTDDVVFTLGFAFYHVIPPVDCLRIFLSPFVLVFGLVIGFILIWSGFKALQRLNTDPSPVLP